MEESTGLRSKIDESLSKFRIEKEFVKQERFNLIEAEEHFAYMEQTREVFQQVSKAIQQAAHTKIANVVSRCLETVFDDPYEFRIIFDMKRGRTEARLVFLRNGIEVDPISASGGGVVDVASFALRLACLVLSKPPLRKLLILDEPFKFVSEEYRANIRALLEALSEDLGFQFFFVTHIPDLHCGKTITIT